MNELKHHKIRASLAKRSSLLAISSCLALAALPAPASAVRATAAGNEPESAADQLVPFIQAAWRTGRTVETSCSGRKSPYTCMWWILYAKGDKRVKAQDAPGGTQIIAVAARRGEGNVHNGKGTVWKSGRALATWNAKKQSFGFLAY